MDKYRLVSKCLSGLLFGVAGGVMGLLGAWIGIGLLLMVAACTAVFYVSIARPRIGILIIVFILASIIFEEALPLLTFGFGSLHLTDMILLGLLGLIPLKKLRYPGFRLIRTPLDWPLMGFYLTVLACAILGSVRFGVAYQTAIRQTRILSYYLLFFGVVDSIRDDRSARTVIAGMYAIAVLVSLAMMAQAAVGESIPLMPGRIEQASTMDVSYNATRILPPGQTLVLVMFIASLSSLAFDRRRILDSPFLYVAILTGTGVLLTYNRSFWVSVGISISLLAVLGSRRKRARLAAILALALVLVGSAMMLMVNIGGRAGEYAESIVSRFASMLTGGRVMESSSLLARKTENAFAWGEIVQHPLLGIGLGNDYRPPGVFGPADELSRYIHNGYLFLWLNTGLIGLALFLCFYLRFAIRALKARKMIADPVFRGTVTGFALAGIGILPACIVDPMFMQWFSVVVIATMIGLSEAIMHGRATARSCDEPVPLMKRQAVIAKPSDCRLHTEEEP